MFMLNPDYLAQFAFLAYYFKHLNLITFAKLERMHDFLC